MESYSNSLQVSKASHLCSDVEVCLFVCLFLFLFLETGFCVALKPVLELALVEQAGLELTEICLPLPPECWD